MSVWLDDLIYDQPTSRLPDDIRHKCLKNRKGTCIACNKLTCIEDKIHEARCALDALLDEREALASVLNAYHDPIVHRLPPEIVSCIFVHLKPPTPSGDMVKAPCYQRRYNERETIQAALTPGRICREWRRIAESTPQLWTTICTIITPISTIPSPLMIQDWLKRSGGLPLFIQITVQSPLTKLVSQTAQKAIALTMSHAHRWEVLDLEVPSKFLPWISESLSNVNLDRLQHIKTRHYSNWVSTDVLRVSASPRRLIMNHGRFFQVSINYEQITHVNVDFLSVKDAKKLFPNAPHLSSCFCRLFDFEHGETERISSGPPIFAPSLHTLNVGEVPAEVWNHFQFPSLEALGIGWPDYQGSNNQFWANIQALLLRSGCTIRELDIKERTRRQDAIVEVLKVTPYLERLSIEGGPLNGTFYPLLDATTTSSKLGDPIPHFLGKLQSLSCSIFNKTYDWMPLIGFLNSMTSKSKRSLRSFEFRYCGLPVEDLGGLNKDTLEALLDAMCGLEIKILDIKNRDMLERACRQCNVLHSCRKCYR